LASGQSDAITAWSVASGGTVTGVARIGDMVVAGMAGGQQGSGGAFAAPAVAPDCTPEVRQLVLPLDHFPVRG